MKSAVLPLLAALAFAPAQLSAQAVPQKLSEAGMAVMKRHFSGGVDPALKAAMDEQRVVRADLEAEIANGAHDLDRLADLMARHEALRRTMADIGTRQHLAMLKELSPADRQIFLAGIYSSGPPPRIEAVRKTP